MKNNIIFIFVFILINFFHSTGVKGIEQFNFDVTEIEILEKGNLYKGLKKGTISTNDGVVIKANEFEYNKTLNKLVASGNVEVKDTINNYIIYSSSITYYKNNELIISKGNSKALLPEITIQGENFEYFKNDNIFEVKKNVKIIDEINNILILSQNINYNKNKEIFFSSGYTESIIDSKYNFKSSDV